VRLASPPVAEPETVKPATRPRSFYFSEGLDDSEKAVAVSGEDVLNGVGGVKHMRGWGSWRAIHIFSQSSFAAKKEKSVMKRSDLEIAKKQKNCAKSRPGKKRRVLRRRAKRREEEIRKRLLATDKFPGLVGEEREKAEQEERNRRNRLKKAKRRARIKARRMDCGQNKVSEGVQDAKPGM
jgi:hypothetical protein